MGQWTAVRETVESLFPSVKLCSDWLFHLQTGEPFSSTHGSKVTVRNLHAVFSIRDQKLMKAPSGGLLEVWTTEQQDRWGLTRGLKTISVQSCCSWVTSLCSIKCDSVSEPDHYVMRSHTWSTTQKQLTDPTQTGDPFTIKTSNLYFYLLFSSLLMYRCMHLLFFSATRDNQDIFILKWWIWSNKIKWHFLKTDDELNRIRNKNRSNQEKKQCFGFLFFIIQIFISISFFC